MKYKLLIVLLANLVSAVEVRLVGLSGPICDPIATDFSSITEVLQDKIALRKMVESNLGLNPLKALGLKILIGTQNLEDELTLPEELVDSSTLTLTCVANSLSCVCQTVGIRNPTTHFSFRIKGLGIEFHVSGIRAMVYAAADLEELLSRGLKFEGMTFHADLTDDRAAEWAAIGVMEQTVGHFKFWRENQPDPDQVWLTEKSILAGIQVYKHYMQYLEGPEMTGIALKNEQYRIFEEMGVEIKYFEEVQGE